MLGTACTGVAVYPASASNLLRMVAFAVARPRGLTDEPLGVDGDEVDVEAPVWAVRGVEELALRAVVFALPPQPARAVITISDPAQR